MTTSPSPRRHDLDALRAFAMLLGIVLHAGLSFTPIPWVVQDSRQAGVFGLLFAAIHGFRMPLFFLLSGFFTAMLWRRRGLAATLWQRALRILLPLVLSMVTIVPALLVSFDWAVRHTAGVGDTAEKPVEIATLGDATRAGDVSAVRRFLADDADPNAIDPATSATPLARAALRADVPMAAALLEAGADPNIANGENYTPLHDASLVGADDVVAMLLEYGADPDAVSSRGEKPLQSTRVDWGTTTFVANLLKIPLREQAIVEAGRERAAELLLAASGSAGTVEKDAEPKETASSLRRAYGDWLRSGALSISLPWSEDGDDGFDLMNSTVFYHLWFLWFLCWLVAAFALYAAAGGSGLRSWLFVSPARWLLVVPLTMIPQHFMHLNEPGFGPDTSIGVVPYPHLLLYYAVFFFFGAAYYDADDAQGRLGRHWWASLLVATAALFAGLAAMFFGESYRALGSLAEVVYTWATCFGLLGLFRSVLTTENRAIRYLSDSSYWLYLAHLPLVIVAQAIVADWDAPALLKFTVVLAAVTSILLVSYQTVVRYTFIGWLLNGRRTRPGGETRRGRGRGELIAGDR